MKKLIYLTLPILVFLSACNPNNVYREYENIKHFKWAKSDVKTFKVDITENAIPYNFQIGFRHIASIQKGVIKINVKTTFPSGKVSNASYDVVIRDQKGFPLGETMGDISDIEVTVEPEYVFAETGTYTFELTHDSKEDELADMMEVGVVIDKTGK